MRTRVIALTCGSIALGALLAACGSTSADSAHGSAPASASAAQTAAQAAAADIAFAQLMIPHHQQAVEMADLALSTETSPEVRGLAQQIKAAQDPEIQQMSGWLQAWGAPMAMDDEHASHGMGGVSMSGMMSDEDMQALGAATGAQFDRLWLTMMIAHHEGAVAMAEQVKAASSDAEVIALANAVISGQTAEIETMQQLLAQQ